MAPNTISLKWGNDEFCIWKDSRVSKIATEILNTQIHKFLIKTLLIDKAQTNFFLQFFVSSLLGFTYLMLFKWHFDLSIIMQKRAIYCQAGEAKISFFTNIYFTQNDRYIAQAFCIWKNHEPTFYKFMNCFVYTNH